MSYWVSIDIGGTFTDCIVADADGAVTIFKARSTPDSFERGFLDVLALAAGHHGHDLRGFLANVERIVHGTTVSTNALVEGKVAKVGFITNKGFPDILTLREGPRKRAFEWRLDFPAPYVAPNLTATVGGRIDALGHEIEPLNEADVAAAVTHLRAAGAEAVGVCLLWSIVNGAHERRVAELLRETWPGLPVTLSHELNPIPREYRRAISTVIDASLHSIVGGYISVLTEALAQNGYSRELLVANCVGGMMPPEEIAAKPIYSVMSGPTLAPIAARHLTDEADVIVIDMGGTTFDVSAIRGGNLIVTPEAMIGRDMLGIPKVDVRSVGSGGGSIARVDVGGLLQVGPQSAGAVPGPACYGTGGTEPTVTDANVVLGIIDPDYFLGGRIRLDRAAAEAAVSRTAKELGVDVMEAAYSIHTTSNHNMITAIEDITVREGINPRDSYLVSGGGATACHIGEMAEILGIDRFMIPRFAAGLSAFGGLISELRWGETATLHTDDRRFASSAVEALLAELMRRGDAFLARAGVPKAERRFEYTYQGRYEYQSWEIEVPFALAEGALDLADLVAAFHAMHERVYTIKDERDTVEFTTWRVQAVGLNPLVQRLGRGGRPAAAGRPEPMRRRAVYLHSAGGMRDIDVHDGDALGSGARIEGPAVLDSETFTALLLPGHAAQVDAQGNYHITVPSA
ncbi:MAG: hydantoinase/oxoprolinase family protein [Alphaproteobacteria bacterium]